MRTIRAFVQIVQARVLLLTSPTIPRRWPTGTFARAEQLIAERKYVEAIAFCREGLAASPRCVTLRLWMARALLANGHAAAAYGHLRQCLAIDPSCAAARELLNDHEQPALVSLLEEGADRATTRWEPAKAIPDLAPPAPKPQPAPKLQSVPRPQPAQSAPKTQPAQSAPKTQPAQSAPKPQASRSMPKPPPAQAMPKPPPVQSAPKPQPAPRLQSVPKPQPAPSQTRIPVAKMDPPRRIATEKMTAAPIVRATLTATTRPAPPPSVSMAMAATDPIVMPQPLPEPPAAARSSSSWLFETPSLVDPALLDDPMATDPQASAPSEPQASTQAATVAGSLSTGGHSSPRAPVARTRPRRRNSFSAPPLGTPLTAPRRRTSLWIESRPPRPLLRAAVVVIALAGAAALWTVRPAAPAASLPAAVIASPPATPPRAPEPPPPPPSAPPSLLAGEVWIHPLAGPERRMPIRDSRLFGAERVGDRPSECRGGHCGIDLGGAYGEPVYAVHDGVIDRVQRAENPDHGGHYVRIAHQGGTVVTQYFHLSTIPRRLEEGMPVKAGDVIGFVGLSGIRHSEPHLHFTIEVRDPSGQNGRYLDPEPLVALWPLRVAQPDGKLRVADAPAGLARGFLRRRHRQHGTGGE